MCGCLVCMYICTIHPVLTEARRGCHPLKLELMDNVSCHAGAGNRTLEVFLTAELSLQPQVSCFFSLETATASEMQGKWTLQTNSIWKHFMSLCTLASISRVRNHKGQRWLFQLPWLQFQSCDHYLLPFVRASLDEWFSPMCQTFLEKNSMYIFLDDSHAL